MKPEKLRLLLSFESSAQKNFPRDKPAACLQEEEANAATSNQGSVRPASETSLTSDHARSEQMHLSLRVDPPEQSHLHRGITEFMQVVRLVLLSL